ncbi:MAG: SDR family NAD(P)-dependent oxidoreductase [Bacteroidetes bacterium]|nr:SDR family NAD(P)-dependent oxidoreductase [Bacteroidota bacterium]
MKKNIFITGTSSGIGYGLAKFYLEGNHQVFGMSRRTGDALNTYGNYSHLVQDLSELEGMNAPVKKFLADTDKLDMVILNAGILPQIRDMKDTPLDEIKKVMDINVWANKILLDQLFENTGIIKQVVAISSGAAVSGSRGWNAYSLSKATLNMLINLYAKEYTNTHFIALAPGIIDTAMQDFISSLPDDERFPVVSSLKNAKGTEMMPDAETIAPKLDRAFQKAIKFSSGEFIDIRNIL